MKHSSRMCFVEMLEDLTDLYLSDFEDIEGYEPSLRDFINWLENYSTK